MNPRALKAEIESLRRKIADLVVKKPEKAVIVLTEWSTGKGPKISPQADKILRINKKVS